SSTLSSSSSSSSPSTPQLSVTSSSTTSGDPTPSPPLEDNRWSMLLWNINGTYNKLRQLSHLPKPLPRVIAIVETHMTSKETIHTNILPSHPHIICKSPYSAEVPGKLRKGGLALLSSE